MADGLSGWVRRWWRGEGGVAGMFAGWVALPFEGLFRLAVMLRNRRFEGRVPAPPLPVVSIGNLTVGGTGKTPVVRWVVDWLRQAGVRPAVVSRGYGRDELMLHRDWYAEVPVVADRDRSAAVARAAREGAEVAVVDDGFQHRRLGRHLDVVLLAAETPFPGPLLPRGPYREGAPALGRADFAIVTRKSAPAATAAEMARAVRRRHPRLAVAQVALQPGGWKDLDGADAPTPRSPVRIITSVAWPHTVRALVEAELGEGARVSLDPFPDHHEFTTEELRAAVQSAPDSDLVVTEKDAVKLREPELRGSLDGRMVHVMALDLVWEAGRAELEAALRALLVEHALGTAS